jgi:hypothetical protein
MIQSVANGLFLFRSACHRKGSGAEYGDVVTTESLRILMFENCRWSDTLIEAAIEAKRLGLPPSTGTLRARKAWRLCPSLASRKHSKFDNLSPSRTGAPSRSLPDNGLCGRNPCRRAALL